MKNIELNAGKTKKVLGICNEFIDYSEIKNYTNLCKRLQKIF